MERQFVAEGSIVRTIWGKSDTVLLVFAGSAAEFALNKSVDWLYFTGRLPADPIGRLFSTVRYAQEIIYSAEGRALAAIDQITAIHGAVEKNRGMKIPDSAYRDVLFMLIDYTVRSFELLERRLTAMEKEEVFGVFHRVGERMRLKGLPDCYAEFERMREDHLMENLVYGELTKDLYGRYRKSLGGFRYRLLVGGQVLLAPRRVKELLGLAGLAGLAGSGQGLRAGWWMRGLPVGWWMRGVVGCYKVCKGLRLDGLVKAIVLPRSYKTQVAALDVV